MRRGLFRMTDQDQPSRPWSQIMVRNIQVNLKANNVGPDLTVHICRLIFIYNVRRWDIRRIEVNSLIAYVYNLLCLCTVLVLGIHMLTGEVF